MHEFQTLLRLMILGKKIHPPIPILHKFFKIRQKWFGKLAEFLTLFSIFLSSSTFVKRVFQHDLQNFSFSHNKALEKLFQDISTKQYPINTHDSLLNEKNDTNFHSDVIQTMTPFNIRLTMYFNVTFYFKSQGVVILSPLPCPFIKKVVLIGVQKFQ